MEGIRVIVSFSLRHRCLFPKGHLPYNKQEKKLLSKKRKSSRPNKKVDEKQIFGTYITQGIIYLKMTDIKTQHNKQTNKTEDKFSHLKLHQRHIQNTHIHTHKSARAIIFLSGSLQNFAKTISSNGSCPIYYSTYAS